MSTDTDILRRQGSLFDSHWFHTLDCGCMGESNYEKTMGDAEVCMSHGGGRRVVDIIPLIWDHEPHPFQSQRL